MVSKHDMQAVHCFRLAPQIHCFVVFGILSLIRGVYHSKKCVRDFGILSGIFQDFSGAFAQIFGIFEDFQRF